MINTKENSLEDKPCADKLESFIDIQKALA